ncbi:MAG: YciI family protein [Sphingorhabdus sp.]
MREYFAIYAWDAPGSASKREAARDAHFAHVETIIDHIAIAGPIKDKEGLNIGSLFVLKVQSHKAAEELFHADPYFAAGVWGRWEIHPFLPAAGEWIGGKIW